MGKGATGSVRIRGKQSWRFSRKCANFQMNYHLKTRSKKLFLEGLLQRRDFKSEIALVHLAELRSRKISFFIFLEPISFLLKGMVAGNYCCKLPLKPHKKEMMTKEKKKLQPPPAAAKEIAIETASSFIRTGRCFPIKRTESGTGGS